MSPVPLNCKQKILIQHFGFNINETSHEPTAYSFSAITAVFTATEYSLIWRMLDLLGFPGLTLYLILGNFADHY